MHEEIQEELKNIEEKRQYILSCQDDMGLADELAEKLKTNDKVHDVRVSIGWESGSINGIIVKGEYEDIRETTEIRKWLREEKGFPAPKIDDYPEIQRRRFIYKRKDKPDFNFSVFCYYGDKTVCKFVEIGKEEKPIFELKCE